MRSRSVQPEPPSSTRASRKQRRQGRERTDEKTNSYRPEPGPSSSKHRRSRSRSPRRDREAGHEREGAERKRRKKSRKDREPSGSGGLNPNGGSGAATATFEMGDDFVPFAPSSEDEQSVPADRVHPLEREGAGGKGKGRASDSRDYERKYERDRDVEGGERKRKYDLVFDDDEVLGNRREATYRHAPWVRDVDWQKCNNVSEMLHYEVEAYINYISPTPVEDEIRGLIVQLVSEAVTRAFPDAKVRPFGSFGTKLYLPMGDIDLVVQSESMAYSDRVNVLQALANALKRAKITNKVTIIAKAKVPIVKFITTHGRLNVDISVNQGNGVIAAQIVNGFLRDMRGGGMALRGLVMIIKAFLSQRGMNEVYTGGLGSYAIVCLAVSFLQMHPKIRRGEIDATRNLGVLVMEFFELYGLYFNYEETGISVCEGGQYFNKKQRGWQNPIKKGLLSIEDPTDPSNDISKGSYGIVKVRTTFAGAFKILASAAFNRAGIMRNHRDGRSFSFQGYHHSEEASILAAIIGVTQETINHRKLIQEVYDNRTLHQLLGVEPKKAPTPPDTGKGRVRNGKTSRMVEVYEADEVDMDMDSDIDPRYVARRHESEDDEESRYDVQPPKKRRKVHTAQDEYTVFTTDDEQEEEGELIVTHVVDNGEDLEDYESDPREENDSGTGTVQPDTRRSYWLSKGIGIGTVDDDDS